MVRRTRVAFRDDPTLSGDSLSSVSELPPHDHRTLSRQGVSPPATPASGSRGAAQGERLAEGTRLGHFSIRRLIGTGGMGRVYEALQENPRRSVAIKVMNHGLANPSTLRRFEFEAQVLARLKHPGIAQIHEVGSHDFGDGGVPWFAMEYIANAKPITDYALDAKLGLRERLKLFRQACDAVAHGHQRGVIHRDLKPSNLLVDGGGLLKVIDFGVARSTDSDMAAATLQTDVGQLIGTVQYMSPEQFDADPNDLDIRSDVYALGVVLHELLAGQLPYDLRKKPIHEAARIVREEDPPRIAGLPHELQIVVSKALAKERIQRYGSAAELSQDIGRWLDGEPIAARAPGVIASVRRLVRRHRALSASVASAFIVLVAALAVTVHLWRDAQRGWAAAEARERELQASIAAKELAESNTKVAVQAQQASDRGLLEVRYAKAIGDGLDAAMKGDGAEVRRASRELDDLRAAGLSDRSRRIEARLLAAFPAATQRSIEAGIGKITAMAHDPAQGRVLALGSGGAAFIDATTRAVSGAVPQSAASAAAFSPDGNRLAMSLQDGAILLVQAPPRRADGSQDWRAAFSVARRLAGHASPARTLAWSADGSTLASGDDSGSLRLWQGSHGASIHAVPTGSRPVRAACFAGDGASIVVVTGDGRWQRWNAGTGTAMGAAVQVGKPVTVATPETHGDRVALALDDGAVEIWSATTMTRMSATRAGSPAVALAFGDGSLVAATAQGVERLDTTGAAASPLGAVARACTALTLIDAGRAVLVAASDGTLAEADLSESRPIETVRTTLERIDSMCLVPGAAPLVALAGGTGGIEILDTLLGTRIAALATDGPAPSTVAASPDRRWIAAAGKDGRVQLWNALTGERAATLQHEGRAVLALAFSPDSGTLAAGNAIGELLRWQLPSGAPLAPIGSGAAITSLAYRPDGSAIALGGTDGFVRLRSASSGEPLRELPDAGATDATGRPVEVRALAFSPNADLLACALADGTMRLWSGTREAGARSAGVIGEPGMAMNTITFDPGGGGTVIAGLADESVRLWAASTDDPRGPTARELAKVRPGIGPIASVAIDPDSGSLLCAGARGGLATLRTAPPLSARKAREAVTAALDARRDGVRDWFAREGVAGAARSFDAARNGLDATQSHALRDLMLLCGPAGAR